MYIDLVYAKDIEHGLARLYQAPAFGISVGDKVIAEDDIAKVLEVVHKCSIMAEPTNDIYRMMALLNKNQDIPRIIGRVLDVVYEEEEKNEF